MVMLNQLLSKEADKNGSQSTSDHSTLSLNLDKSSTSASTGANSVDSYSNLVESNGLSSEIKSNFHSVRIRWKLVM